MCFSPVVGYGCTVTRHDGLYPQAANPDQPFYPKVALARCFLFGFGGCFVSPPTTIRRTTFILSMSSQLPFVFGLSWWLLPLFGISPAHSSCCRLNSAFDSLTVHAKFFGSGGSISIYLGFSLLDSLVILRQTFVFQEGLRVPLSLAFCFWQCVSLIFILEGKLLTLYTHCPTVLGVTFSELWLWGNVRFTLVPQPPTPRLFPCIISWDLPACLHLLGKGHGADFPNGQGCSFDFQIQTIPHPQESFLLCSYALFSVCFFKNLNCAF